MARRAPVLLAVPSAKPNFDQIDFTTQSERRSYSVIVQDEIFYVSRRRLFEEFRCFSKKVSQSVTNVHPNQCEIQTEEPAVFALVLQVIFGLEDDEEEDDYYEEDIDMRSINETTISAVLCSAFRLEIVNLYRPLIEFLGRVGVSSYTEFPLLFDYFSTISYYQIGRYCRKPLTLSCLYLLKNLSKISEEHGKLGDCAFHILQTLVSHLEDLLHSPVRRDGFDNGVWLEMPSSMEIGAQSVFGGAAAQNQQLNCCIYCTQPYRDNSELCRWKIEQILAEFPIYEDLLAPLQIDTRFSG